MNNIGTSFRIMDATSEWLHYERLEQSQTSHGLGGANATPIRKPSFLKLCPVIIETLKKIYSL
jgi:hypothetical protein